MNIQEGLLDDWNRDIKELMAIETDVDIHLIKADDLLNSSCSITPSTLVAVEYMIQ